MAGPTRLVQLDHPGFGRRVALVDGDDLHLLGTYRSVYQFAQAALDTGLKLRDLLSSDLTGIALAYQPVWALETEWRFLPSFDQPNEPARCLVSGSGPAWFLKGSGVTLHGHGEALAAPPAACSPTEGASLAALYLIDKESRPRRIGLSVANDFWDPGAGALARLSPSAIGPELWLDAAFGEIQGSVEIRRGGAEVWSAPLAMGGNGLENIENNLFSYPAHRRPGDVHVHFLGSPTSSHASGVRLETGDQMIVAWDGFGRPLINRLGPALEVPGSVALPL